MTAMRIAQIAPLYESVPPVGYGGTERVIAAICEGLVGLGHDVTLFATGSSTTPARLEAMAPSPLRTRYSRAEMIDLAPHVHLRMLAEVYSRADEFDLIHSHLDVWTLPFAQNCRTPTVLTMHGRLDLEHVRQTLPLYPGANLVSISNHQRRAVSDIPVQWAGTVYNGLNLDNYLMASRPDRTDYLAFVGRIHPEKGPESAVAIARRARLPLRVAAKIDPLDIDYYTGRVEPLFRANSVDFIGELSERDKPSFFAGARATLFPSDWPEPFGLVMIESLAAGTPVVALRRGSVPEILVDGVTGFICDDIDEMIEAVRRVDQIDPEDCRRRAMQFDTSSMCAGYERVYDAFVRTDLGEAVRHT